jgi:hypothetical protein
MNFEIECEREDDGRWLAEVPQLPGVLAYGDSANDAMAKAQVLPFESWLNVSRIARLDPRRSPSALRRDLLAIVEGTSRLRGVAERRVATQASIRVSSHP